MSTDETTGPAGDVTGRAIELLADVLYLPVEQVDPAATFENLGLDSILAVEYLAVLRDELGVDTDLTTVYDSRTPAAFLERLTADRPAA